MRFLRFILKVDNFFSLSIHVAGSVFVYQMKKILYKQVQSSIPSLSIADNLIAHYVNLIVAFPSSYWTEKDYEQFYELYPFSFPFSSVSFILLISMIIRNILLLKQSNQMLLGQLSLQNKLVIMLLLVLISS